MIHHLFKPLIQRVVKISLVSWKCPNKIQMIQNILKKIYPQLFQNFNDHVSKHSLDIFPTENTRKKPIGVDWTSVTADELNEHRVSYHLIAIQTKLYHHAYTLTELHILILVYLHSKEVSNAIPPSLYSSNTNNIGTHGVERPMQLHMHRLLSI